MAIWMYHIFAMLLKAILADALNFISIITTLVVILQVSLILQKIAELIYME